MTTDTITSTLDLLAIACIERPNDFAAWAALCDYCEENGLRYHPRAMYWVIPSKDCRDADAKTIAIMPPESSWWQCHRIHLLCESWAAPLVRSLRK